MAATATHDEPPTVRCDSPSPKSTPSKAVGGRQGMADRCLSTGSSTSHASSTDGSYRDSLGSSAYSRHSSASYGSRRSDISLGSSLGSSRYSTGSFADRPSIKRRGFSRPEGTYFAASAKHRESVLSLGSIAHLQYYFARTGLLDGKGAQLARKRNPRATLDLSSLDTASLLLSPVLPGSDADSSYASMRSSPDLKPQHIGGGPITESPVDDTEGFYSDEISEPDLSVLPPTTSTYKQRQRAVSKPPTLEQLRTKLTRALDTAPGTPRKPATPTPNTPRRTAVATSMQSPARSPKTGPGWFEIQGMQILDHMTLAIRAAKVYYTSHEHPERLDTIRSEKEIRSELLSVMEVLKHMATRNFAGGMRDDEQDAMTSWIQGIRQLLAREDEMADADKAERAGWKWLKGDWTGREIERELAFLAAMDTESDPLPAYTPVDEAAKLPTPFLESFQNGVRLVKLHNAAVQKYGRRFGSIGTFHTDTQKPYRCIENLRYWSKAAELRWEVILKFDVLGVVYNNNPQVWVDFEEAIWKWCRKVREEITAELVN
ncbi:uncharacterized protein BCR38DRAFT_394926 [Pseudomassariella vexata]|uniref:Uncharacterized protein n=1 Tax=Pseudomassariella vexata TaxID=1141098 RepID=A0A1Y2DSR3_9PEZI|nr:uncharacterized protein BCR38DRAFT_394926 [Pseudomassariella vexata]ORY62199.1 hypothetical protein BCR38DRAFT_394926 [Pseudomassariella vexata]